MATPTRAEMRKRLRRGNYLGAAAALFAAAVLAALLTGFLVLSRDLERANDARDALADQVRRLGGTPVAGPRGEPGEDGTGTQGERGEKGDRGGPGPDSTVPGPTGPPGPSGSPGTDGSDGDDGADGAPGADSTVPGPQGPPGRDGVDGKDGADGRDGKDGQTCPDGYRLEPAPDDPDALVCRRTTAPDPQPTASSSPTGLPGLLRRPRR